MGVLFVEAPLRRLHRVAALSPRFLHHHRFDKLHIFGDAVLLRILLYQRRVGFHLRTDRGIGSAVAAAAEQGNGTPKQDNDKDYQYGNPAACDYRRNKGFRPCYDRLNRSNGGSDRRLSLLRLSPLPWLLPSVLFSGRLWQMLSPFSVPPLRSATWS